ncbi:MAG: hypothetical protein ACOCRO_00435 [Halanaerobiales bacterium]
MRTKLLSFFLILTFVFTLSIVTTAASTTSYSFRVLNNPDARQVAYNIAKAQHDMSLEVDEVAQFISIIEGRIMSLITEDIVEKMLGDGFGENGQANYDTNTLDITVIEGDDGIVTVRVRNVVSGEESELEYNPAEWPDISGF